MAKKADTTASGNPELESIIAQIRKEFGEESIMRLGEDDAQHNIEVISTGSFSLDMALGAWGCRAAASSRSSATSPPARRRSRST